uniref:DUF6503 family protein n=1 Tax=Mariniflexile sp. TaxID=1979402 RepID=UPI004048D552
MKNLFILVLLSFSFYSCKNESKLDANQIINKSIEVSGGAHLKNSTIDFDFRDKHYTAIRKQGKFRYERTFHDSITIKDVLSNSGFQRYVNDELVEIPDSMAVKYASSVNSVHYFSVLPFGLNAAAVNKKYIALVKINDQAYHKIEVTFNEKGGGEDFDDVFLYWVNTTSFKVDYMAYSYAEDDGLGMRFREAYNERFVNNIRFLDYNNFKPKAGEANLNDLDTLFENNELDLLSKIELKNITVN